MHGLHLFFLTVVVFHSFQIRFLMGFRGQERQRRQDPGIRLVPAGGGGWGRPKEEGMVWTLLTLGCDCHLYRIPESLRMSLRKRRWSPNSSEACMFQLLKSIQLNGAWYRLFIESPKSL